MFIAFLDNTIGLIQILVSRTIALIQILVSRVTIFLATRD